MLLGHFDGRVWVHLSLWREEMANQYKTVLTDHLCPMIKHFNPNESGFCQDDLPPSTGHEGSPNGLMNIEMMQLICYGLHSYGCFWNNGLDSALTATIKTLTECIFLGGMLFIPPVQIQRLSESVPQYIAVVILAHNYPTCSKDIVCSFLLLFICNQSKGKKDLCD